VTALPLDAFPGNTTIKPRLKPVPQAGDVASDLWRRRVRPVLGARPSEAELMDNALRAINRLLLLPEGWDGAGAHRVDPEAALVLAQLIHSLIQDGSADPQVFPLTSGGISCEWLVHGNSVEVQVEPDLSWSLWVETAEGEDLINETFKTPGQGRWVIEYARRFLAGISERVQMRVPQLRPRD
jgi:hypothetical protein